MAGLSQTQHEIPLPTTNFLTGVQFFAGLTPADLDQIASWFREDHFEPDETIFHESDPAARWWVVKDGQVKIVKYGPAGKEIVIEVISPGEVFGGAAMLMPTQPATAQALSPATLLSVSIDQYRDILQMYPVVAVRVIEALGERLRGVIQMRAMASERVERRIAHVLMKMADKCGDWNGNSVTITLSLTRQDIADFTDTTLETAIRVMSKFRKDGLIHTLQGGFVVIDDAAALRLLAQV